MGGGYQRDETVVASPGVVGFHRKLERGESRKVFAFGSDDEQGLTLGYLTSHLTVGCRNLTEHRSPIGGGVRPRQLHTTLRLPFCR